MESWVELIRLQFFGTTLFVIRPNSDISGRIRIVLYPIHCQHSDTVRLEFRELMFTEALNNSQFYQSVLTINCKIKCCWMQHPTASRWDWRATCGGGFFNLSLSREKRAYFWGHLGPAPIRWVPKSGQVVYTELPQLPKPKGISNMSYKIRVGFSQKKNLSTA